MKCREIVELMTRYLEGTLSQRDRARFEEHIAGCDGCHGYLAQLRKTRISVRGLADVPVPPSVEQELLEAFRGWRPAAT